MVSNIANVHISDSAFETMPFVQDFENTGTFPGSDSWIENPDTLLTWTLVPNANTTSGGSHSIMMNNFYVSSGAVDSWI